MRKQVLFLSTLLIIFLASCQKQETAEITPQAEPVKTFKSGVEDPCYEESFTIYGGQSIEVGTLTVSNDEDEIFVTYDLSGTDWYLGETHLYVGNAEGIPTTGSGNPKIGHFPYAENHNIEQVYTYTLSREDFEDCFAVAAHAVVEEWDANGNKIGEETAWADGGSEFQGKRWGWFVEEFCVEDCVPDFVCNDGAFTYSWPEKTNCFTDYGFDSYGWNYGPFYGEFPPDLCVYSLLYSCPTSCSPDGMEMGQVRIEGYQDDFLKVNVRGIPAGYIIKNVYVYAGTEPLPVVNGNYSINPEDYPFKELDINARSANVTFPNFNEDIYFIVYVEFQE